MRERLQEGLNQLRAHSFTTNLSITSSTRNWLCIWNSRSGQTCRAASLFGNFIDRLMGDVSKWQDDALSVTFNVTLFAFLTASDTGA